MLLKWLRQRLWDAPGDAMLNAWVHLRETRLAFAWSVGLLLCGLAGAAGALAEFGSK